MKTYKVELSCIYNGVMTVQANNEKDALEKATEMLNSENLNGFPDTVEIPNGHFDFGEATADYCDEEE